MENLYKPIIDITLAQSHFVRGYFNKDFVIMEDLSCFVPLICKLYFFIIILFELEIGGIIIYIQNSNF